MDRDIIMQRDGQPYQVCGRVSADCRVDVMLVVVVVVRRCSDL